MSVYNGQNYLQDAIDSILDQSFKSFEFIIINDRSTDNSSEILRSFSDERIRILNNTQNIGLAASLNQGFKVAIGEYIVRMDSDDISDRHRLKKQVKFMDDNPDVGICGSWVKVINGKKMLFPIKHDEIVCDLLFRNPIPHPSVIMRKSLIERHQLVYDITYEKAQDYELWLRALKKVKLANIPKALLYYRIHNEQASSRDKLRQDSFASKVLYGQLNELVDDLFMEDFEFHTSIFLRNEYDAKKIKNLEIWFNRLEKSNDKNRLYQPALLKKTINYYWLKKNLHPQSFRITAVIPIFCSRYFHIGIFINAILYEEFYLRCVTKAKQLGRIFWNKIVVFGNVFFGQF